LEAILSITKGPTKRSVLMRLKWWRNREEREGKEYEKQIDKLTGYFASYKNRL
jgi:hypothetical protein